MRKSGSQSKVALHADDLGLSLGFNEGILDAASRGLLTSTCVRVNGAAYRDAIERIIPAMPHVAVGLHLNIVEGRSTRHQIGSNELLCHPDGSYRLGFVGLLLRGHNARLMAEIEADFRDQIDRALRDLGSIDHLNSHQHSHAVPAIFALTCRLAAEYKIPVVRLPREYFYTAGPLWRHLRPWYTVNLLKSGILNAMAPFNRRAARRAGVHTPEAFVGILYTGFMTLETVLRGVQKSVRHAAMVEVLLHPARILGRADEIFLDAQVRDYVYDPARQAEIEVLTSSSLCEAIDDAKWALTTLRGTEVKRPCAKVPAPEHRLRTVVIFDETPFYQPRYFRRLLDECPDIDIVGAAIVKLPKGGKLKPYLIANWREIGLIQLMRLALKSTGMGLLGRLPRVIRGDFIASSLRLAKERALPVRVVDKVNVDDFRAWVRGMAPDLIISSNSLVFGEDLIRIPRIACINRHSALLPSYGGILPVFRSVQFGESHTGAAVHYMVKGIDEGGVLARMAVPIFPTDSVDRLYKLCFIVSFEATRTAIARLKADPHARPIPDDGIHRSYFSFPNASDWKAFRSRDIPFIR